MYFLCLQLLQQIHKGKYHEKGFGPFVYFFQEERRTKNTVH